MIHIRSFVLLIAVASLPPAISAAMSPALAETVSFESSATMLSESCGAEIDANCHGVSFDAPHLRECLSRNQDAVSAQCRADYIKAFDAIARRIAARSAVGKLCQREKQKICAEAQGKPGDTITCLLNAPTKGLGWGCNQALTQAGYR
jgi:hypothetical protein